MRRLGLAPKLQDIQNESLSYQAWLQIVTERLTTYSGAVDPVVAEVPENQWIVFNNTTVPEVRIWTNIAGVLKKSAAFT